MVGTVLAMLYASARDVTPSAAANTAVRTRPVTRDSAVPADIASPAQRRLVEGATD